MIGPSLNPSTCSPSSSGKGAVEAEGLKAERNMAAGDEEMVLLLSKEGKIGDKGGRPSSSGADEETGLLCVVGSARRNPERSSLR